MGTVTRALVTFPLLSLCTKSRRRAALKRQAVGPRAVAPPIRLVITTRSPVTVIYISPTGRPNLVTQYRHLAVANFNPFPVSGRNG